MYVFIVIIIILYLGPWNTVEVKNIETYSTAVGVIYILYSIVIRRYHV